MRLLKKIIILFLLALVSAIAVFAITYNLYQNKIQSKIEALVNETIEGNVKIKNLSYSFFLSYPKLKIYIEKIELFENEREDSAIVRLANLHLQLDVKEALGGFYLIDEFTLESGEFTIIGYRDSTINILNAVALIALDSSNNKKEAPLNIELKKTVFNNIQINYSDYLNNQQITSKIEKFESGIILNGDSLIAKIGFEYTLDSLIIENKRMLRAQKLTLNSDVNASLSNLKVRVSNGILKLNLLESNIEGVYNGGDKGLVDFRVWARHTDLSELAKMDIFREENLPRIEHGEIEIEAFIKGYTKEELPLIKADASLKDLVVHNRYGKVIDNARFVLSFESTNSNDIMDSHLTIDSIALEFTTGGYFKGKIESKHFKEPEFKIAWEASELLENIDKIFKITAVKKIHGKLTTKGLITGTYAIKPQQLLNYGGSASITIENGNVVLLQEDYVISDINGTAFIIDTDVGVKNLTLNANSNTLAIEAKVENLLPYVLNQPAKLSASLAIRSGFIKTKSLLAFDKSLADSNTYIIRDFDMDAQVELASNALNEYALIPTAKLKIFNFTALVDGLPALREFEGEVISNQNLVTIKDLKGVIGKSHVDFSVSISNYADYLQFDNENQMVIDMSLKSEQINVKDFFTINQKFVLPKSYEEEVLQEVVINTKIITTNFELQKKELLPEFELQITGLQFKTLYTPIIFKDIFVFGLVKDNNVYINSMFGKFGRSDVFMNAEFDNVVATKDTITRPLVSRVTFNSGVLDLNELIKLDDAEEGTTTTLEKEAVGNPFADNFPITDFQLNIGELNYYDATIKELSGLIKIEENNLIHLHEVKLKSGAYGIFEFDGDLDASSRTEAILNSTIKISDVDLSKLNVTYVQNEEEVKISDHFEGQINGEIIANVPILQDFSFDLARLMGKIKVKMTNGVLINYAPLKEMGNYFKNKDLTRVRFDTLKNTMIFNAGKILLPFMTINTTLGTINLMGFQDMENNMEYDIQVPIKLVAGSALTSLFASKKGDDQKDDKIKKGGKGKYVTVHISGKDDIYNFKLGKKHMLTAPPGFKVD